ncbi:TrkH family potassium uptake protein [Sphaerochaeta halotolerans]|uniref:TrkH family potassium uptake protein n=2 Tax=Sphaerochaeta halotolerans TaxID=2293840 RepID=A0A372MKG7_9SPIR|nr:TrkH family potassium uptake protein [Sphaerochaeta halotolerans]
MGIPPSRKGILLLLLYSDKLLSSSKNSLGRITMINWKLDLIHWTMYIGFSVLETILLRLGGLSPYDTVTVTFSSLYVDFVATIFMLIAGTNFTLYYKAISGKLKSVLIDGELRFYLGIWTVVSILAAWNLTVSNTYGSFGESFRYRAFLTAPILTTTGFATTDYVPWPAFPPLLFFLLFFIGGLAGSAGDGVKVVRVATLFKMGKAHSKQRIHPKGIFQVRVGSTTILEDSMPSIATSFLCLGNIGIGFGQVGPTGNFVFLSSALKGVCSFLMLVNRLELFTVFTLFPKHFWKR